MDTSRAAAGEIASRVSQTGTAKRQQRSVEKRRIVEETLVEGASVARARERMGSTPIRSLAGASYISRGDWEAVERSSSCPVQVNESSAVAGNASEE